MKIAGRSLMITCLAEWPTGPVKLEWSAVYETELLVTGAHGFCFMGNEILLCEVAGRGLCIPGGHVEPGESPVDCLIREVREEAAAELGSVVLLGHIVADHSVNPSYVGKYPRRAAQSMFVAKLTALNEFVPSRDSLARRLVPVDALPRLHHEWHAVLDAAYRDALASVTRLPPATDRM